VTESVANTPASHPGRDTASQVLLVLALVGAVVMLFFLPFLFAPPAFLAALVGVSITDKNRRFGLMTTLFVTLCFIVGATVAIWGSRPLF
jgi:uncharacterized membrane protein YeaQ/YmgE (transglycosylase-associated protein family)